MEYKTALFCEFDKYAAESYCAVHGVDKSLNIGDITKADEKAVPDFNTMFGGSPCFVAGTHILTNEGYKNIEEVAVDDMVYTKEHRLRRVARIGSDGVKDVLRLTATGILPLTCTENHPLWVRHKLREWDNDVRAYRYYLSDPEKLAAGQLRTKMDYIGVPIIGDFESDLNDASNEALWLAGRYVADGHIGDRGVVLSIGIGKLCEFDNIKMEHKTYQHTESCCRIVFNKSSELYQLIASHNFGAGAINKTIPLEMLGLPRERLLVFLEGYMSGDGCRINDTDTRQATTISRSLAEMLVLAVQKVYRIGCKVYYNERPQTHVIEGRTVNQHDTYMIRFLTGASKSSAYVENNFVWYPVKKITWSDQPQKIYNIEVEEDHTYIANGASVFNCQDFSIAGKQGGAAWTCKDCGHTYNPLEAHYTQRDKCPVCGSTKIEKTRSSLLVEWLRFLREKKPRFAIYENVKNITGSRFRDTFDMFVKELEEYGYNVYWQVLNAKHYGIPQNRERVYCVIVRKDLDNGKFKFPEPIPLKATLSDLLEDDVDEKYYLSDEKVAEMVSSSDFAPPPLRSVSHAVRTGGRGSTDRHTWDLLSVENGSKAQSKG